MGSGSLVCFGDGVGLISSSTVKELKLVHLENSIGVFSSLKVEVVSSNTDDFISCGCVGFLMRVGSGGANIFRTRGIGATGDLF